MKIVSVESKLEGREVFRSFPAAAGVFAPRLLAVFGEDHSRFSSAAEVQRYCGVAPVTERSGKQNWVHWRYRSSKFQRQTLVEWAGLTIPRSYWAEQFYRQHRARGAGHQAALRALAFKWVPWRNGVCDAKRGRPGRDRAVKHGITNAASPECERAALLHSPVTIQLAMASAERGQV